MDTDYKRPLLASIFRGFGWVTIVGAFLALIIGLAGSREDSDAGAALIAFLSGIASALVFFGLSQLIDYIGRIAFNSTALLAVVERHASAASARAKESAVSGRPASTAPGGGAPPSKASLAPTRNLAARPAQFFYLDGGSQPIGPVDLSDLEALENDAVVAADTLICREGETEWQPLRAVLSTGAVR